MNIKNQGGEGAGILVVDDEKSVRYTLDIVLKREGYEVVCVESAEAALECLARRPFDLIITDVNMPGSSGLDLLDGILKRDPSSLVILITAFGSEAIAVDAMKRGAYDYLPKPFANDDLKLTIRRALEKVRLRRENELLREQLHDRHGLGAIIGRCEAMQRVYDLIGRVAPNDVTVMITGESGTGKEMVANAIHSMSLRRDQPFIRVNCAALPENLIESELFGYERGAFSGAVTRRLGKFELAHQGTLFLDEIGDMSLPTQTKILRILQEKEFERLGGQSSIVVDVRVLAATNRNLMKGIREGVFREDLYYRLNVVNIQLPPLRDRLSDLPALVAHFAAHIQEKTKKSVQPFSPAFMAKLMHYNWPGNVRELQNLIERVIILEDEAMFQPDSQAFPMRGRIEHETFLQDGLFTMSYKEAKEMVLKTFERRYFETLIEKSAGNISKTARLAGMYRKNLYLKLKDLALKCPADSAENGDHREEK